MKKNNKSPQGKKQQGIMELTDQDLQQVQGGLASQTPERSKKGDGGTTPTPK